MVYPLIILGTLFSFAGLVAYITVLIHAFKSGFGTGLLTVLCAPFALYYAFIKFEHPRKALIVALFLFGSSTGAALVAIGNNAIDKQGEATQSE